MCGLSCCFGSEGGGRIVFPSQFFFPLNMFQQLANSYLLIRTDVFSHSWVVLPTKFLSVQAFRVFFFFVVHLLFLIVRFRLRFSHSRQMYLNGRKLNCFAKKNDAVCSLRFLSDESAGMYLVSRPRLSDKRTAHRTQIGLSYRDRVRNFCQLLHSSLAHLATAFPSPTSKRMKTYSVPKEDYDISTRNEISLQNNFQIAKYFFERIMLGRAVPVHVRPQNVCPITWGNSDSFAISISWLHPQLNRSAIEEYLFNRRGSLVSHAPVRTVLPTLRTNSKILIPAHTVECFRLLFTFLELQLFQVQIMHYRPSPSLWTWCFLILKAFCEYCIA